MHPALLAQLIAAVRQGDPARALSCQAQLDQLIRVRGRANIHANKLLCKTLGLMEDHVTAPLPRLTAAESAQFLRDCAAAGFPFPVA